MIRSVYTKPPAAVTDQQFIPVGPGGRVLLHSVYASNPSAARQKLVVKIGSTTVLTASTGETSVMSGMVRGNAGEDVTYTGDADVEVHALYEQVTNLETLSTIPLRGTTTADVSVRLTRNMLAADARNQISLANNRVYHVHARIVARRRDVQGDVSVRLVDLCVERRDTPGTVAIVGTPTTTLIAGIGTLTWPVTWGVGTAAGILWCEAAGEVGKTIDWLCDVSLDEIGNFA